jgi:hypothetical protein
MKHRLALTLAVALCTTAVAAAGNTTYGDAAGDSGTAPDLTKVEVTDSGGFVAFKLEGTLVPSSGFEILIDTDRSRATGNHGNELWVSVFQEADGKSYWDADRWSGSKWEDYAKLDVVSRTYPGREEIGFRAEDAGMTGPFNFTVISVKMAVDGVEGEDRAPDSIVPWTYELASRPAATLVLGGLRLAPSRAVAGKTLTISLPVRRTDTNAALAGGTATCTVRVGARLAKGHGATSSGWATCRFLVPPGSSGKTARGSIVVTNGGTSATKSFSFRVV